MDDVELVDEMPEEVENGDLPESIESLFAKMDYEGIEAVLDWEWPEVAGDDPELFFAIENIRKAHKEFELALERYEVWL